MSHEKPNASTIILVSPRGLIWAAYRRSITYQGLLECPGGGIEDGEMPEQAALRELLEETGITRHPGQLTPLGCLHFRRPVGDLLVMNGFLLVAAEEPDDLEPQKRTYWREYHVDQLTQENCTPAFYAFLTAARSHLMVSDFGLAQDLSGMQKNDGDEQFGAPAGYTKHDGDFGQWLGEES